MICKFSGASLWADGLILFAVITFISRPVAVRLGTLGMQATVLARAPDELKVRNALLAQFDEQAIGWNIGLVKMAGSDFVTIFSMMIDSAR